MGVDGFFVISGYLITSSWARSRSTWTFLKRRCLRILPGFVVAFLISVLVGFYSSHAAEGGLRPGLVLDLLALSEPKVRGAFPTNPIAGSANGSMWTIAPEVAHYLIIMALGLVCLQSAGEWERPLAISTAMASPTSATRT